MKNNFVLGVVASLLISTSPLVAMNSCEMEEETSNLSHKYALDVAPGVKELSDYLYIGQKEPGLYFVMERIDDAVPNSSLRLAFWEAYVSKEKKNHDTYRDEYFNNEEFYKNIKGLPKFYNPQHPLTDGVYAFEESLTYHSNNELWIAYVCSRSIEKADDIVMDDIEMTVPIMADKDFPMFTAAGIGRSFHHSRKAAEAEKKNDEIAKARFKVHPGSAMNLLSIAGKVMKIRHLNMIYQINGPVCAMRELMFKALSKGIYYGNTWMMADETYEQLKSDGQPFESVQRLKKASETDNELSLINQQIQSLETMINNTETNNEVKAKLENLKDEYKEKEAENEGNWKIWRAQRDKEINEFAEKIEKHPTSPIRKTLYKLQIFDKERNHIIFEHDLIANTITVNDQKLTGEETVRFNWFYHGHNAPLVTIDLDVLSSYLTLMEWTI